MKFNRLSLLFALILFSPVLFAQDYSLHLKNGFVKLQPNIRKGLVDSFNIKAVRFQRKTFAILQFESIPTEATKKLLSANGIELLEYIPNNAYTVSISGNPSSTILELAKARSILQPSPEMKMESRLASGIIPPSAIKVAGTIDVWISFPKTYSSEEVINNFKQLNFDVLSIQYQSYRILSLRIASNRLKELAALPFVEFVQAAPGGDQPLNYNSRSASGATALNASIANGGKGLNGEGITVGIGDNADVQTHIDFSGRLINRAAIDFGSHGYHTTGTLTGAGNVNELFRGYAPKATIVSQVFNGIILNASTYVNDYGMVITNNSYGDNIDCGYMGTYDLYSRLLDQMAFDMPSLTNVFAAGNSGGLTCPPFLPGYHTVLGGYQSAKNVITVGATTDTGFISGFSSRGPVKDGRLKPEITAMGQRVASASANNGYFYGQGTSMAAPAVAGGLTLLYQRYRQLNGGASPKNGLMKALLCNGALDKGNTGPDFQYGFGWMNLLRSIDMLENNHYFIANSTNGSTNTHAITVPANTAQLKVMLYWNDPAASPLSVKTLVNDLDLEVTDASLATTLPKILDTANNNLSNVAVSGADHMNNIEQVVINNPAAGNYTIRVTGRAITQNPSQEYFVVYDAIPVQLKLTSPAGGEGLTPSTSQNDQIKIGWEAYGYSSGTVTLEFSSDGGSSWSTIATGVDINRLLYSWTVPNVTTDNALVRITKEGTGESSTSNAFTIVGQPVVSLAAVQCEGYINLNWTAVTGATDYEVMMLQGDEMKTVATTTGTTYTFNGLSKDSVYWVTVRAGVNGKPGRRAIAISRQPNTGTCSGNISDNDLKIDAILSPSSGRKFTSTQLNSTTAVKVRVKNLDDAPVNNFDVKYSINGGAFVTENVTTTIAAGATYDYTFTTTADLSAAGNYNLVVVVKNSTADPVSVNDTATTLVRHADNQPLNLTSDFIDNIETATAASYEKDTVALSGLERYDFSRTTIYGRLRSFINSGIAHSGTKALTLDANRFYSPGNTNYLTGTFNLTNYNTTSDDIRLDFQFNNHGQLPNASNKVWIRGNDAQAWIEAYDLDDNQEEAGVYRKSASIEISDLLAANGQSFST
ncbi:MAG: S8 family serine peptidase, partial [Flavisolibacter sp.]|nr:S8 family serine peptidase [Flavisolibacter sp.]